MAGISFSHKGNFENLDKFLKAMQRDDLGSALQAFGEAGAQALATTTLKRAGSTLRLEFTTVTELAMADMLPAETTSIQQFKASSTTSSSKCGLRW